MELIGYFFILFGILGLITNGHALLTCWGMKNTTGKRLDAEAVEQTENVAASLSKHLGGRVIVSLIGLAIGIYISFSGFSVTPSTKHNLEKLWPLLAVYAFGFGVTIEAVLRASKITGRLTTTELEWQFNGILNALYLALSIWLFIVVVEFISWWALLPLMLLSVQVGVVAAELLQRHMGTLRGFLFLASPAHLIWSAYILWLL